MHKRILVVDDEPQNLELLRHILNQNYQLVFATCGRDAIAAAEKHEPDLILLDIMMPEMDGYETCRLLKSNPRTDKIPIIFVTTMREVEDERRGFEVGAVDYITKPVSPPIVLARVETHLKLVRSEELNSLARAGVIMLGEAGHYNDTDTGLHIWRMAAYAKSIAQASGWDGRRLETIELAAPMHDTGKIGIPDAILKAPRKLTPEEWVIMMTHCQIGYDILAKCDNPVFEMAAEIALNHHERWDGKGYPNRLKGEAIPICARVVAIADVFDALTTVRPYKKAWPVGKAIKTISNAAGEQFDPSLVDVFLGIQGEIKSIKAVWDARQREGIKYVDFL